VWRQHVIASGLCRSASFLLQAAPFISFPVRPPRQGSARASAARRRRRRWEWERTNSTRFSLSLPCDVWRTLLSCLDSMRSVSTMADSIMMSGLALSFVNVRGGSNGVAAEEVATDFSDLDFRVGSVLDEDVRLSFRPADVAMMTKDIQVPKRISLLGLVGCLK